MPPNSQISSFLQGLNLNFNGVSLYGNAQQSYPQFNIIGNITPSGSGYVANGTVTVQPIVQSNSAPMSLMLINLPAQTQSRGFAVLDIPELFSGMPDIKIMQLTNDTNFTFGMPGNLTQLLGSIGSFMMSGMNPGGMMPNMASCDSGVPMSSQSVGANSGQILDSMPSCNGSEPTIAAGAFPLCIPSSGLPDFSFFTNGSNYSAQISMIVPSAPIFASNQEADFTFPQMPGMPVIPPNISITDFDRFNFSDMFNLSWLFPQIPQLPSTPALPKVVENVLTLDRN